MLADKTPAARCAMMTKVGTAVKKSFQLKKFDAKTQDIKFLVAGLATYLPNISAVAMEVTFPFVLQIYFKLAGINAELETLQLLSPSRTTVNKPSTRLCSKPICIGCCRY